MVGEHTLDPKWYYSFFFPTVWLKSVFATIVLIVISYNNIQSCYLYVYIMFEKELQGFCNIIFIDIDRMNDVSRKTELHNTSDTWISPMQHCIDINMIERCSSWHIVR